MLYKCAFLDNDFSDQSALVHFTNCVSTTTTAADRVYVAAHEAGNPAKCKAGVAKVQCFAPLADDWRLVPGSDLVDAGNTAYLTQAWLPVEYQNKDFYGKTRVPADAHMLDPEPFFGDISWHCKSGPHSLTRVDWAHYLDFAAKLWDCQCSRR